MTTAHTINLCEEKLRSISDMIPITEHNRRISEIDHLANEPGLWSSPNKAAALMKERQKLSSLVSKLTSYQEQIQFYRECLDTIPEEIDDYQTSINQVYKDLCDFEFRQMFNDPVDDTPAILSINAGAGGLEAANWVTILLRMYSRFADNNDFKIEILDMKPSEEHGSICTDSVSIRIIGNYAYGFLKSESGVHRLIRNSPFNSDAARHTSFAGVSVTPDIEDTIDIQILDKDLEITAMRAGGAGGQYQNKTNSAIRIIHIPTGINIAVRTERDQHANRRTAMKMLKAKLYDLEQKKRMALADKKISEQSDVSFGHQIRSYTESPQAIVKDHRTNYEIRDFHSVLDGNIGEFIKEYLKHKHK